MVGEGQQRRPSSASTQMVQPDGIAGRSSRRQLADDNSDALDRAVVADLLVKHLCPGTAPAARTQALSVLAGMLELNAEERVSVGLTSRWELEKPELVKQVSEGKNEETFAEMWAKYLQAS